MLHSHRISHVIYGDLNGQTWSRYHASDSMGRKAVLIRYHPKRTDFDDEDAEADRRLTSMNRPENVCAFACRQFVEKICLFCLRRSRRQRRKRTDQLVKNVDRLADLMFFSSSSGSWDDEDEKYTYYYVYEYMYVCTKHVYVYVYIGIIKNNGHTDRQTLVYMYTYVQTKNIEMIHFAVLTI